MLTTIISIHDNDLNLHSEFTLPVNIIHVSAIINRFTHHLYDTKKIKKCLTNTDELEKQFSDYLTQQQIKHTNIGKSKSLDAFSLYSDSYELRTAHHQFDAIPIAEYLVSEKPYHRYNETIELIEHLLFQYNNEKNADKKAGLLTAINSTIHQKIYTATYH